MFLGEIMGTRNLTCVVKGGEFKVAQYGQWDGYPSGQGKTIVKFLLNKKRVKKLRKRVDKIVHLSDDEVMNRWKKFDPTLSETKTYVTMEVSNAFNAEYPHLDRDMGANVLYYVIENKQPELSLNVGFGGNGLYCEWAYVVDLDTDCLEIYNSYDHKKKATGKFANLEKFEAYDGRKYEPVSLVKTYKFSELTKHTIQQYDEERNKQTEDD